MLRSAYPPGGTPGICNSRTQFPTPFFRIENDGPVPRTIFHLTNLFGEFSLTRVTALVERDEPFKAVIDEHDAPDRRRTREVGRTPAEQTAVTTAVTSNR